MNSVWVKELRAPFLLLPVIFVPLGCAIAWVNGFFDPLTALLTLAGVVSLHASVNVLNDYFDFRSGLDLAMTPTPFSGGSRVLPAGELKPRNVLFAGVSFLGLGLAIGSYFIIRFAFNPILTAMVVIAGVSVVAYSPLLAGWGIGEFLAGLNFGPLVVLGSYFLQTGRIDLEPLLVGAAVGVLVGCILYLNEFPDVFADTEVGRRHLVVRWGKKRAAERFKWLIVGAYLPIVVGVVSGIVTPLALLSFAALPKIITANRGLNQNYDRVMELIPSMASMVMATLWAGLLLLAAYLIHGFVL